jgi:hypothetical protein
MLLPLRQLQRYYETGKHLKPQQVFFIAAKPLRRKLALYNATRKSLHIPSRAAALSLMPFSPSSASLYEYEFSFLNLKKKFENGNINWNFSEHGLLWNYHLNYFDFLHQENFTVGDGLILIHHFLRHSDWRSHSYDPYPVSLRSMSWIKFLIRHQVIDSAVDESLYRQLVKLNHETEQHLGANHLLENGFALLFGAFYFHDEKLFQHAENILLKEIPRQILNDGAHIELSTMYHRIVLHRMLDCINLMKNKRTENNILEKLLQKKSSAMLAWMNNMTFRNGIMPCFNDSTADGAPAPSELNLYAKSLDVYADRIALSESGYRRISYPCYEIIVDTGNIIPSYNPGHTHADMLNFCLNVNDKPVIVDCGTSTYENNLRRKFERSTEAHNTVSVDGLEQSDMWASFRVGRRARILESVAEENSFAATIIGFTPTGIAHKRLWTFLPDRIAITDFILDSQQHSSKAYLHFHPDTRVECSTGKIFSDKFKIEFNNHSHLSLEDYEFAEGFNMLRKAKVAVISFSNHLETEIIL